MTEGWRRTGGPGRRGRRPRTAASPQLSWRRAGSRSCGGSSQVISQPAGPPQPRLAEPVSRRNAHVWPVSDRAGDL